MTSTNTDFTLFKCSYIHPQTSKIIDCGEMRGYHAEKFIQHCEQMGINSIVERTADDQSLEDFILNLSTSE